MQVKQVTYERVFNLGNYETERIGLVLELDAGEKFSEAMIMARKAVLSQATNRPRVQSIGAAELERKLNTSV